MLHLQEEKSKGRILLLIEEKSKTLELFSRLGS